MALAGDHVVVKLDDTGGTPRQFANGDITSVDLGQTYDMHDVTGFGDAVHHNIQGQLQSPVTIKGYLTKTATTGTHTVIQPVFAAGTQVTLEVQIGNNAAPTTDDPKFTGEFYVESYTPTIAPGGAIAFTAALKPALGTAPVWGTV